MFLDPRGVHTQINNEEENRRKDPLAQPSSLDGFTFVSFLLYEPRLTQTLLIIICLLLDQVTGIFISESRCIRVRIVKNLRRGGLFANLLRGLLRLDGGQRISASQALQEPLITTVHLMAPHSRAQ